MVPKVFELLTYGCTIFTVNPIALRTAKLHRVLAVLGAIGLKLQLRFVLLLGGSGSCQAKRNEGITESGTFQLDPDGKGRHPSFPVWCEISVYPPVGFSVSFFLCVSVNV